MYKYLLFVLSFAVTFHVTAQPLSSSELLEKSIAYHDPQNLWGSYTGIMNVVSSRPGKDDRLSVIALDQPNSRFKIIVSEDGVDRTYEIHGDSCELTFEGRREFSEQVAKKYRLNCEQAKTTRDYYNYLYGLPMKLRDKGVNLDPDVRRKVFKEKEYLVVKATYDESIGTDTWYFYFDPESYAMEAYQFFHDESLGDGEYILLSGMEHVSTMKLPKVRAWYMNKDDRYLGTDTLVRSESMD